jgi:Domain of unknown function (DUF4129)
MRFVLALLFAAAPRSAAPVPQGGERAELRRILSRPEFRDAPAQEVARPDDPDVPKWLEDFSDSVIRFERGLQQRFRRKRNAGAPDLSETPGFSRRTLPVVVLLIVAGGVPLIFAFVRLRLLRRSSSVAAAPAADLAPQATARDPRGWEREAEALLAQGRLREAVRARYLASLSFLAGRGAIRFERFKTNGEYVDEVGRAIPRAASTFAAITRQFDWAWYGCAPVDELAAREFFEREAQCRRELSR